LPVLKPCRNHRTRWAELPWVNESGVDLFRVSSILDIDWNENKSWFKNYVAFYKGVEENL